MNVFELQLHVHSELQESTPSLISSLMLGMGEDFGAESDRIFFTYVAG